ncbi:MAG: hypothetical protein JXA11_16150 [Phycisphaerae bacterium]|nr:hypothetical protein [Phycisphaerae bacterium]
MKFRLLCTILLLSGMATVATSDVSSARKAYVDFNPELKASEEPCRARLCLNGVWDFLPVEDPAKLSKIPDAKDWAKIRVPSYWKFTNAFEYPKEWEKLHQAWYRRSFDVPKDWQGKRVFLQFGGILYWAKVFLNGREIPVPEQCGFLPITLDITPYLRWDAPNELYVAVRDISHYGGNPDQPECIDALRGIWQDVWLFSTPNVYTRNVKIETSVSNHEIATKTCLADASKQGGEFSIQQRVLTPDGQETKTLPPATVTLPPNGVAIVSQNATWSDPHLWSPDDPYLYYLETTIREGDEIIDRKMTRFGFRQFEIRGRRFYLNGERITMRGLWDCPVENLYPERLSRANAEAEYQLFKDMNLNTIRWHGIAGLPLPLFYELADEKGFLAVAGLDSFSWWKCKPESEWPRLYQEAALRYENHPSIVLWNANNEEFSFIYWEGTLRDGPPEPEQVKKFELLKSLTPVIRREDTTRPVMYHGNYDLFGFAPIYNVHYPVYATDLRSGAKYFRNLRNSHPKVFARDKPILVGEFWYVPELQEFFEPYCGEQAFRDPHSTFRAGSEYNEQLLLGWRTDKIAGVLGGCYLYGPLSHPFRIHETANESVKIPYKTFEGPYMKPTNPLRPRVNPGWDKTSPPYTPNEMFHGIRRGMAPLAVYLTDHPAAFFAGQEMQTQAVVINDFPQAFHGEVEVSLVRNGKVLSQAGTKLNLPKSDVTKTTLTYRIPEVDTITSCTRRLRLLTDGKERFVKDTPVTIYPASFAQPPKIETTPQLYDTNGKTAEQLKSAGISYRRCEDLNHLNPRLPLIIGYHSKDETAMKESGRIADYVAAGGRCLVLEQPVSGGNSGYAYLQAKGHPIFAGINGNVLRDWQTKDNYVTEGCLPKPDGGNFQILADFGANSTPLLITYTGKGMTLQSQLRCSEAVGRDPVATRVFYNMLSFIASDVNPIVFRQTWFAGGNGSTEKALGKLGIRIRGTTLSKPLPKNDILILGSEAFRTNRNVTSRIPMIRNFVENGGTVIAFPQHSSEGLNAFTNNEVTLSTLPMLKGRRDRYFLETESKPCRGINPFDFLGWLDWLELSPATKWSRDWQAWIDLREAFSAFQFVDYYAPCWDENTPREEIEAYQRMTRAEQDAEFARTYHKVIAAGVLARTMGKGRIVLIQLPVDRQAEGSAQARRVLSILLTNLGVPMRATEGSRAASLAGMEFVDLKPYANVSFRYDPKNGGWTDQGPLNDAAEFPTGLQIFAGVPFEVIDPARNHDKAVLVLRGKRIFTTSAHASAYPPEIKDIAVNRNAWRVYFLHTLAWATPGEAARYVVHYADGSTETIPLISGKNIGDWWKPAGVPDAKIGWIGKNASSSSVGAYVQAWRNPRPGVKITSIDFISPRNDPVPVLIGVTILKPMITEWVDLDEPLHFAGYTIIPTRIEAFGTFSTQLSVWNGSDSIAKDLGLRKGVSRSLTRGNETITLDVLDLQKGRVLLKITLTRNR